MSQRAAIITGAGRGIGRATAIELHARGYRLALVARTERDLHQTNELCGGRELVIAADVSDPHSPPRIVSQAADTLGRVEALVNAAGVAPVLDIQQTTPQRWREIIDVNLSSAFYMSRAVWSLMQSGGGVIVNLSSFAARDPFGGFSAYASAKAGLNLLGLSLAREGAPSGIRVHTIAPAAVETRMFRQILTPEQFPAEKALSPRDVAQVIVQCITGELRHTSGEVIWLQKT
jgi:3-oxoacyl-[acyl-carrier protein] reductase